MAIPWTLLISPLSTLIERIFPDKEQQDKAKAEMMTIMYDAQAKEVEAKSKVVIAEATGESWMQRNWRPVLMFTFIALIINNYILLPYAKALGIPIQALQLPPEMWTLLTIGVGGYVVGRSGEKIYKSNFNHDAYFNSMRDQYGSLSQQDVDRMNKALKKAQEG